MNSTDSPYPGYIRHRDGMTDAENDTRNIRNMLAWLQTQLDKIARAISSHEEQIDGLRRTEQVLLDRHNSVMANGEDD